MLLLAEAVQNPFMTTLSLSYLVQKIGEAIFFFPDGIVYKIVKTLPGCDPE